MVRTRVGYAGGHTPDPTYHRLGDHTETLQIDYDPSRIAYEDLLAEFTAQHDPTAPAWSRQYMSAIFTSGADQERAANGWRERVEASTHRPVLTEIQPLHGFYLAEDYHQKYRLRNDGELYREFRQMYPRHDAFVDSTAVARVNGFLGGEGSLADLVGEVDRYGLSDHGKMRLTDLVEARSKRPRVLR